MEPKASVIIPAYDTEAYIGQAIQSVLDQTEQRFEIIVVDDGSSDDTVEVVKGFADERIRLYVNEENRGASGARNRAIEEASGEWIALLDSDDWYVPERLEKLLQAAHQQGADIIADNVYEVPADRASDIQAGAHPDSYESVREEKTLFSEEMMTELPGAITAAEFILGNKTGPDNRRLGLLKPLFKRAFLQRKSLQFDEEAHHNEDINFYLSCLLRGARFVLVPQAHYVYRRDRPGSTGNTGEVLEVMEHRGELNHRMFREARTYRPPDAKLRRALQLRHRGLRRMMHYHVFRKYLHAHEPWKIWREVLRNPYGFFVFLLWEKPWKNYGRIQRALKKIIGRFKRPLRNE